MQKQPQQQQQEEHRARALVRIFLEKLLFILFENNAKRSPLLLLLQPFPLSIELI
jgi:hypothetical protein